MIKNQEIQNAKAAVWTGGTLKDVLRQLRKLEGCEIDRTRDTIVCSGKGREFLRGLKTPIGWIVRFDSRLIVRQD